jgi:hypothetical protein
VSGIVNVKPSTNFACKPFQFAGDFARQVTQGSFRQLGSRLAIVARVGGGHGGFLPLTIARDASHGGLARSFLPVAKHLSEKRPDHQRRRIDCPHAKQIAVFGEHPFDPFGG